MPSSRPVNLNLTKIRMPIMAVVSILHRISGVVLFLLIPALLYGLQMSLHSPESYAMVFAYFQNPVMKLLLWATLSALLYHLIAGIRHLLMDMGWGHSLIAGRFSSWLVVILSFILIACVGVGLWL